MAKITSRSAVCRGYNLRSYREERHISFCARDRGVYTWTGGSTTLSPETL